MQNLVQNKIPDLNFKQFRIAARGLIVLNHQLLLVSDDGVNWYTPGGRLEPEESLSHCMEREVYEETGLVVKAGPMIYLQECLDVRDQVHKIHHYFLATILAGSLSDQWVDEGGCVKYRQYFSLEEIKNNPKVFPRFLAEGHWRGVSFIHQLDSNSSFNPYRGCEYVKGYHVLEPYIVPTSIVEISS